MRRLALLAALLSLFAVVPATAQSGGVDEILKTAGELRDQGKLDMALDALRDALDAHPDDARLLLELGRTSHMQANEVFSSANASLGRLALLDAITWYKKALTVKPAWPDALRLLGQSSVAMGDFETAADAYRRATVLEPEDGESWYQLGYSLGNLRRFSEAVEAFAKAERILGPDPRILLNRGISLESLSDAAGAERCFLTLIRGEADAGRPGSTPAKSGFTWLWRVHKNAGRFDLCEAAFASLAKSHPELIGAHWYLGHARLEQGDAAGAVEAFTRVTVLSPNYAFGWQKTGEALVLSKRFEEAVEAVKKLAALDPEGQGPRDLTLQIARAMASDGKRGEAIDLLTAMQETFPDDINLIEARADLRFGEGQMAEAIRDYRAAAELDPFADEILIKAQKAATRLLREGEAPADLMPLRPKIEAEPDGTGGATILGFERSEVFARVSGRVSGARRNRAFAVTRAGDPGSMSGLVLTLIPTLDATSYSTLSFRAKGPKGTALTVWAKDCYDQFEVNRGFTRLRHRDPVLLTGDWKVYELPLSGFESVVTRRPIPMNRARLRALIFDVGLPVKEGIDPAPEVEIDDIELCPADGMVLVLADFEREPDETIFVSDGAATPFAPTLFSEEQVKAFRPDANTFVSPAIFGDTFDRVFVHGGDGSYRLTLARDGAASGSLTFNPDRSFDDAVSLVFWARGQAGGEKVRVTVRDAIDQDLGNPAPASAPRLETADGLVDGWFFLGREWKLFRIPRAAFPDVDFRSLTEIRLHFGTDEENPVGTTVFLDDIGWE